LIVIYCGGIVVTEKKTDMLALLNSACPEGYSSSKAHFGNWGVYAAAAGATLAMSTNAEAQIVYTTLGQMVTRPAVGLTIFGHSVTSKNFTVNIAGHKQTESIYLRKGSSLVPPLGAAKVGAGALEFATGGGVTGSHQRAAKNFGLGTVIGAAGQHFYPGGSDFLNKHTTLGAFNGFFKGVDTGFLGFSYAGHYGWIEAMVSDAGSPGYTNELKVIAYAYNSVSGATINPGQGIPVTTPEPDTAVLGLLASGAAGLAIWRRRRKEVDAPGV
jgi:hypothetical protein